jgi:hypothetical protein
MRRWHRWEAQARLEDGMREGLVAGSAVQLVPVCRSVVGAGESSDVLGVPVAPAPPAVSHLRPSEARELAFCLLELAELADRRSQERR